MRAIPSIIEVVAELIGVVEKNQVEPVSVPDRLDNTEQVFTFLPLAAFVAPLIDKPGNPGRWPILLTELCDSEPAGAHEIHPPIVVGLILVFFPLHQRRGAGQYNMLALVLSDRDRPQKQADPEQ